MKKMNIGLVGAGFMGKAHMVAFSNMPKLFTDAPFIPVFKTVCDIVPEIAEDSWTMLILSVFVSASNRFSTLLNALLTLLAI